jgi:thiol-disulfide isomerase/thioredoxin
LADTPFEKPLLLNGSLAPGFTLPDLAGTPHSLEETRGRVAVVNFWSAECPWSARADEALGRLLPAWGPAVILLTIASNANEPIDLLRTAAGERGLPVVLHDANQRAAGLYGAQTTPHLFVLDAGGILAYQGAFDNVTFRRRAPTQIYLQNAVEALLAGRVPEPAETPPYGCTIVRHAP